jgi:hypothetical protein
MCIVNHMFHMDEDYMWRWYTIDPLGNQVSMSAQSFFNYEDASWDYDRAHQRFLALVA